MNESSSLGAVTHPFLQWRDADDCLQQARWCSLADSPPPQRVQMVDDGLSADTAFRLASEGVGLLWCGDYQNARLMMQALVRRLDAQARRQSSKKPKPKADSSSPESMHAAFVQQRKTQAQRARLLGLLLLPFDADHSVPLPRAADVREAGAQARGAIGEHYVASLRELQGLIGAHQWRKKGVYIPALKAAISPHYGVFSPVRGEYVDLVADTALPASLKSSGKAGVAFDIGTGSGVLAAVLAQRGVRQVVGTDQQDRALACASDNLALLKLSSRVQLLSVDLFPEGLAQLIVCNPPWLPWPAESSLEHAVYDPDSRMLRGFLSGLAAHLSPGGEGWLILSDLAEHLDLRSREELLGWIREAGLQVLGRSDAKPQHARASDESDPLFAARSAELTSLWRLGALAA
ncbi:methyltransferase [Roseateles sp.]|uniref:methyltransferase n=1 Tax=Roseateles sp. TaxID=1971397 RepID=UPI003BA788DF